MLPCHTNSTSAHQQVFSGLHAVQNLQYTNIDAAHNSVASAVVEPSCQNASHMADVRTGAAGSQHGRDLGCARLESFPAQSSRLPLLHATVAAQGLGEKPFCMQQLLVTGWTIPQN